MDNPEIHFAFSSSEVNGLVLSHVREHQFAVIAGHLEGFLLILEVVLGERRVVLIGSRFGRESGLEVEERDWIHFIILWACPLVRAKEFEESVEKGYGGGNQEKHECFVTEPRGARKENSESKEEGEEGQDEGQYSERVLLVEVLERGGSECGNPLSGSELVVVGMKSEETVIERRVLLLEIRTHSSLNIIRNYGLIKGRTNTRMKCHPLIDSQKTHFYLRSGRIERSPLHLGQVEFEHF